MRMLWIGRLPTELSVAIQMDALAAMTLLLENSWQLFFGAVQAVLLPAQPKHLPIRRAISPYAQEAVAWARNKGIVRGMADNRFEPEGIATRAQMAAMLCRLLGQVPPAQEYVDNLEEQTMPSLTIKIGNETFNATLLDNSTTRALLELLPLTATMTEMNGNEEYTYLSNSLPVNTERPERIQKGDLMLYGSDCLVLFYDSFATSYSYTRLGHIDDPAGLEAILTNGSVEVTFQVQ